MIRYLFLLLISVRLSSANPPVLTPEESMAIISVPEDYQIDLTLADPIIQNPVDIVWDGEGRMLLLEERYDEDGEATSRISRHTDSDADGWMDLHEVLIQDLKNCRSILPVGESVYFFEGPNLVSLSDGKKQILQEGFDPSDTGLTWQIDNSILIGSCSKFSLTDNQYTRDLNNRLLAKPKSPPPFLCDPFVGIVEQFGENDEWKAEFISSHDPNFQPVKIARGPDKCYYVIDRYQTNQCGRIYRIIPVILDEPVSQEPEADTDRDLLEELTSDDQRLRNSAQQLLIEVSDPEKAEALNELLRFHPNSETRLHAFWTLHGMKKLEVTSIIEAYQDDDYRIKHSANEVVKEMER